MEFVQEGRHPNVGIKYLIEYYNENGFDDGFDLQIQIYPIKNEHISHDYKVETPQGIWVDSREETKEEIKVNLSVDPDQRQGGENIKIVRRDSQQGAFIEIPSKDTFEISKLILKHEDIDRACKKIREIYDSRNIGSAYISFIDNAEDILSFQNYVDIVDELAVRNQRVRHLINNHRYEYFESRVLNPRKQQYISSIDDLIVKLSIYNSKLNVYEVNINKILSNCLFEIYQRQSNSGLKFVEEIISRIYPESKTEVQVLSRQVLCLFLSIFEKDSDQRGKILLSKWVTEDAKKESFDLYSGKISNMEQEFRKIDVREYDKKSIGDYLYYIGINIIEKYNDSRVIPFFEVAINQAETKVSLAAEYWFCIEQGHQKIGEDSRHSIELFEVSINHLSENGPIVSNLSNDSVEGLISRSLAGRIRATTVAYNNQEEYDLLLKYLDSERDRVSELIGSSWLLSKLNGIWHDSKASSLLSNGSLSMAKDHYKKAVSNFSKIDDERARSSAFTQLKSIEALECEISMDFEQSSEIYGTIADVCASSLENTNAAKAYRIRSDICVVKSRILSKDMETAKEKIDHLATSSGSGGKEELALQAVVELFNDYEEGRVSETDFPKSKYIESRGGSLFPVKNEYSNTFSVISACQVLHSYGISKDILDPVIRISIQDSFTPKCPNNLELRNFEDSNSDSINLNLKKELDQNWEASLPSHIYYQIEKVRMKELTQTGDYLDLAGEISRTFEIALVPLIEYHGRKKYGETWESKIWEKQKNPKISDQSLGNLKKSLNDIALKPVRVDSDIVDVLNRDIIDDRTIINIRNRVGHGAQIEVNKQMYRDLVEYIKSVLKDVLDHYPAIVLIEDVNSFGQYQAEIQWRNIQKKLMIKTDADLEIGNLYYIPHIKNRSEYIHEFDKNEVQKCRSPRAQKAKKMS